MVRPGAAILLGPGSTTQALARLLVNSPELTVVTNSLLVAQALMEAPHVEVIVTGGTLRRSIHALVGPAAEESVESLRASQAFISGNGFSAERGLSTPSPVVAAMDRALAGAAQQVVVLADHTKIGQETMCQTVPAARVHTLITDSVADARELEAIRERGVARERDEAVLGESSVAAPIFDHTMQAVGAIGVVGDTERIIPRSPARGITGAVTEAARGVSRELGSRSWPGTPPD